MTTFEEIPSEENKSIGDLLKLEEEEETKIEKGTKEQFVNEIKMILNENKNVNGNGSDNVNGNGSDNVNGNGSENVNDNGSDNVNGNGGDNVNENVNGNGGDNGSDNGNESNNDNESDNENENDDCEYEVDISDLSSCLLYTSPSPRDLSTSRMPSSA